MRPVSSRPLFSEVEAGERSKEAIEVFPQDWMIANRYPRGKGEKREKMKNEK
jgi:hypothetical protein